MPFVPGFNGLLVQNGLPHDAITTTMALHPDCGVPPANHALMLPYPAEEALRLVDNVFGQARWVHGPQLIAIASHDMLCLLLHPSVDWNAMGSATASSAQNDGFNANSRDAESQLPATIDPKLLDNTGGRISNNALVDSDNYDQDDGVPAMARAEGNAPVATKMTRHEAARQFSRAHLLDNSHRQFGRANNDQGNDFIGRRGTKRPFEEMDGDGEDDDMDDGFPNGASAAREQPQRSKSQPKGTNSTPDNEPMPPPTVKKPRKPYPKNRRSRRKPSTEAAAQPTEDEAGAPLHPIFWLKVQTKVKFNNITASLAEESVVYDSD